MAEIRPKRFFSAARGRAALMWLLAAVCVVCAAAWLVSTRWTIVRMAQLGDSVSIRGGVFSYLWSSDELRQTLAQRNGVSPDLQWEWRVSPRARGMEWRIFSRAFGSRSAINIGLWFPAAVCGLGAGALWLRRERKVSEGHCACGYDLAGSPGVCPECGAPAA
jgi:hypothetical protein